MSKREPRLLLEDVLEAIAKIKGYTRAMNFERFVADEKTVDAVIRNFEIIGEAATQMSGDFKEKTPQVDWYKLVGLRNRIIHEYFGIDHAIIWKIIQENLEALEKEIRMLLK